MGSLLSVFRPRPSEPDLGAALEDIDVQIEAVRTKRAQRQAKHRAAARALILYSSATFIALAAIYYTYHQSLPPAAQRRTSAVAVPLGVIGFPAVIFVLKRFIDTAYNGFLKRDTLALDRLEARQATMLNDLIERTNFKKTQQIINKFQSKINAQKNPQNVGKQQTPNKLPQPQQTSKGQHPTGMPQAVETKLPSSTPLPVSRFQPPPIPALVPGQPYVTAADLQRFSRSDVTQAPLQRSPLDKVVDFVLNDGPNHRFALICKNCFTHNGLVRQEELGIRWRCVCCNHINGQPLPVDWRPVLHSDTTLIQTTPSKGPMATNAANSESLATLTITAAPPSTTPTSRSLQLQPQSQAETKSDDSKEAAESEDDSDVQQSKPATASES